MVEGDVCYTYEQFDVRVNRLANLLRAKGMRKGERLLWMGQNSHRLLECLLAAAKLGAICCPANWRMSESEMAAVIEDFAPHVIIWQEAEVGDTVRAARGKVKDEHCWIQHDSDGPDSYEALLAIQSDRDDEERIEPELPVLAVYTAAFGGRPSAALITHSAVMYQNLIIGRVQGVDESSVNLNSGPMCHIATLMTTLAVFHHGGCNAFIARMNAEDVLKCIEKERVTHAFLPPPTIEQIRAINAEGKYDVSSCWATADAQEYNGNPMVAPASSPWGRNFGGYGQTEVMGMFSMRAFGGSTMAGRPISMVQVRIVDETGQDVPPGETGEIVVRGALVMSGYFDRDRPGEENETRSRDGWHHTNDLGKREEDGSLVFVGPKTTIIKSAAENVYPAEVENCLRTHPAVADVCVIGVPDPKWEQSVKAVVVLRSDASATPEELIEHCKARIASYKKPRFVDFADALPKAGFVVDRKAVDAAFGGGGYPKAH
ncbi:AMP-binding protein [Aromatoleum petrolei]|uniref:AMP-binding protein n=1 Tax=Aromatoleum petrolei TaxID=76116 RepID=UPI001AEBF6C6|nr:AMP-binding protein [Aromatoleum petrolei]